MIYGCCKVGTIVIVEIIHCLIFLKKCKTFVYNLRICVSFISNIQQHE